MLSWISDPVSSKIARRLTFLSSLSLSPSPPSICSFIVPGQTCVHYFIQVCSAFRSIALHRLGAAEQSCLYLRRGSFRFSFEALPGPRIISIYIFMRRATRNRRGNRMHRISKDESHTLATRYRHRRCLSHPIVLNFYFVSFLFPLHTTSSPTLFNTVP